MKKNLLLSFTMVTVLLSSCSPTAKNKEMVKKDVFGSHNGKEVYLLTLTNKAGNVLRLTNFGAKINWIEVPDKNGKKENVTFGYDTFEETQKGDMSFGSVVGRYANRIAHAKFTLDGVVYNTPVNNGPNTLHG
jgi:aldose 1-epimerase